MRIFNAKLFKNVSLKSFNRINQFFLFTLFGLIFFYFIKNYLFQNYLFYNQYDIVGNLYVINLSKVSFQSFSFLNLFSYIFKYFDDLQIYTYFSLCILIFNLISLFYYLKLFNIFLYDIILD